MLALEGAHGQKRLFESVLAKAMSLAESKPSVIDSSVVDRQPGRAAPESRLSVPEDCEGREIQRVEVPYEQERQPVLGQVKLDLVEVLGSWVAVSAQDPPSRGKYLVHDPP